MGSHPGLLPHTIALCANLDHPGVANDGLAGVAVGVETLRRLEERKTKYTYKLVLAAGIIGTEYYLGGLPRTERDDILECLCLWMLGSRTEWPYRNPAPGPTWSMRCQGHGRERRSLPSRRV